VAALAVAASVAAAAVAPQTSGAVDTSIRVRNRAKRTARAFQFVEEGEYTRQGDVLRAKEARKVMNGVSSGRLALDLAAKVEADAEAAGGGAAAAAAAAGDDADGMDESPDAEFEGEAGKLLLRNGLKMPQASDRGAVPLMEWWDEAFLPPLSTDATRGAAKRNIEVSDTRPRVSTALALEHSKFHALVHHPVPTKALGGEKQVAMPVYVRCCCCCCDGRRRLTLLPLIPSRPLTGTS